MAKITLRGRPCNTIGELPAIGSTAPDFQLTKNDLSDVSLADFAGKKKLISIVPSLDTPVCANSTRIFNQHAKAHPESVILVVSTDLPFAQGRFCSGENLDNVISLSLMRSHDFAKDYGMLIVDGPLAGVTGRAVVVLDENNQVIFSQLIPEIAQEPDYQSALAALSGETR
jgi:thiol peroxidase